MSLSEYCASCKKWDLCNDVNLITCDGCPVHADITPHPRSPHPYCNAVWHSCQHKNDIVDDMLGLRGVY